MRRGWQKAKPAGQEEVVGLLWVGRSDGSREQQREVHRHTADAQSLWRSTQ